MEISLINFYDRIKNNWETKKGLLASIIFIILIYFFLINQVKIETIQVNKYVLFIGIPLFLSILIFLYWLYSTNRFFINTSNKISAGVFIIIEEPKEKQIVTKILKKVLRKINKSEEFKNIQVRLLPANFCIEDSEINNYHKDFNFLYDLIIRIFVESGNYDSIEKIVIEKLTVTFKSKSHFQKKRIFFDTIDLISDMNLQLKSRNWEYLFSNSGLDKKKYIGNIYHTILFYLGFYAIYENRFEDALEIIKPIFNPKKLQLKINKQKGNKFTLNLQMENLAEGRLATILTDLYFYAGIKNYHESDIEKALNNFTQLESLVKKHPNQFHQYIAMARWSYELGDINQAKHYNDLAKSIKPNSLLVILNLAFFGMIDDNVIEFCNNYYKIFKQRKSNEINWVDVLSFQLDQKAKLIDKSLYLNFSTTFIDYLFIEKANRNEFKKAVLELEEHEKFNSVYKLGNKILNIRASKLRQGSNSTKRIKRKKRKNKRK